MKMYYILRGMDPVVAANLKLRNLKKPRDIFEIASKVYPPKSVQFDHGVSSNNGSSSCYITNVSEPKRIENIETFITELTGDREDECETVSTADVRGTTNVELCDKLDCIESEGMKEYGWEISDIVKNEPIEISRDTDCCVTDTPDVYGGCGFVERGLDLNVTGVEIVDPENELFQYAEICDCPNDEVSGVDEDMGFVDCIEYDSEEISHSCISVMESNIEDIGKIRIDMVYSESAVCNYLAQPRSDMTGICICETRNSAILSDQGLVDRKYVAADDSCLCYYERGKMDLCESCC